MSHGITLVAVVFAIAVAGGHIAGAQPSRQRPPAPTEALDRRLEDRVFVRLARDSRLGSDIRVRVRNGVVVLTGSVPGERAKMRAGRLARHTPGVLDVRNDLHVDVRNDLHVADVGNAQAGVIGHDPELASRAAEQIAAAIPGTRAGQDWWLEGWRVEGPDNRWHFTIESEDGTIRLGGDVARDEIVRTAIEAVRTVPGVRSVRSDVKTDAHIAGDRYPYSDDPYGSFPYGYGLAPLGDGARGAVPPSASPGRPTHR